ncbi:hypothetical protein H4Q26_007874 [Puccinia striiformis f. sp. tritici PST-130]|nr:hypothetical protein H4Q26_007874 [Puccinia striiformis f. sp. tritici PST-130]
MLSHPVAFIVVISVLLNASNTLEQAGKLDVKCAKKKQLIPADCVSAYKKIIYDRDLNLDTTASSIQRAYGSCVTNIDNPKYRKVPRAKIEDAFNQIGAKCNGLIGHVLLPGYEGVHLWARHCTRRGARFEENYQLNFPMCIDEPTSKEVWKGDCMEAYRLIPANPQGRIVAMGNHVITNTVSSTIRSCTVSVWTSDGSLVTGRRHEMDPNFRKLISKCSVKGGWLITKGTSSPNGNLILQAAARK